MVVAFIILRNSITRILSPLVDEFLKNKDHRVVIFFQPRYDRANAKAYDEFTPERNPQFRFGKVEFVQYKVEWLADLCANYKVDCLITEEGYPYFRDKLPSLEQIKKRGIRVVSICSYFDIALYPKAALECFDKVYYISDFLKEAHFAAIAAAQRAGGADNHLEDKYRGKFQVCGFPGWDSFLDKVDGDSVRSKYSLPAGAKAVVFMPPPIDEFDFGRYIIWGSSSKLLRTFWALRKRRIRYLQDIWNGPTLKNLVMSIRKFCDRNRVYFVIKNRRKASHFKYMFETADIYVSGRDEEYYPLSTTRQLMAISCLCIANYSMGLIESVIAGVPAICIDGVPSLDYPAVTRAHLMLKERAFSNYPGSPFNYPGCVYNVHHTTFPDWISAKKLSDLEVKQDLRNAFINRFAGISDESITSCQRIYESIADLCRGKRTVYNASG